MSDNSALNELAQEVIAQLPAVFVYLKLLVITIQSYILYRFATRYITLAAAGHKKYYTPKNELT